MKSIATSAAIVAVEGQNNLVDRWLKYAGVAEKSAVTYKGCLKQMHNYFVANGIVNPTRADIENWRDSLIQAGKSAATVNLYLTSAKLFFRWLAQEGLYPNVADHIKSRVKISNTHKKDALTVGQARQLIKSAGKGNGLKALRDVAIVALMTTTGLRCIEVVRANVGDIRQRGKNFYLYVQGKGRGDKAECVEVPASVMSKIREYLKARGKVQTGEPLFVSTSRRNVKCRLETQSISRMIKSNLRAIGLDIPTLTAHSLRHTAATIMIEAGQELRSVQLVLRHKSINTTTIYDNTVARWNIRAEKVVASRLKI